MPRRPAVERRWLLSDDGVRLHAEHHPGPAGSGDVGLVVVHGFSAHTEREANRRVIDRLAVHVPLVAIDLRGHGRSTGLSTLGGAEIADVAAAVQWARLLGWRRVITVGFSMGAAIVVRHAGELGGVEGAVAVSGPAFWNYRGTPVMRRLHFGVENPAARQFVRHVMGTRVIRPPWPTPFPLSPEQAAELIPPIPFLVVHGTDDPFFPDEHPRALAAAAERGARERGLAGYHPDLWLTAFGHAEAAVPDDVLDRIAGWAQRCGDPGGTP